MKQLQLAEALGVSSGEAHKIKCLPGMPDRSRYKTDRTYLRKVARICLKHGIHCGRIIELAGKWKPAPPAESRAPARAPAPPGACEDDRQGTQAPVPGVMAELFSFDESLKSLRTAVTKLGGHLARFDPSDPTLLPIADKYQKLQAELRQSERQRIDLAERAGQLFARDDVYATTSVLWVTFRETVDTIIAQISEGPNLPTWIEECGGTVGDDHRGFQARIRDKCRALVERRVNDLADTLAAGVLPGDMTPPAEAACRAAMVAELERVIERLKADP